MSECNDNTNQCAAASKTDTTPQPQPPSKRRRLNEIESSDGGGECVTTALQLSSQNNDNVVEEQSTSTIKSEEGSLDVDDINNDDETPETTTASSSSSASKTSTNTTAKGEVTLDANSFLFRSPASKEEIEKITNKLRSQINLAHEVLLQGGYDAFCRMKRKKDHDFERMTVADFLHSDDEEDMFGDGSNENSGGGGTPVDGMDSDDENAEIMKNKERLAMLEDAVVKGSPRRYQVALVELAKKQNTIVNLGTGQGKILIYFLFSQN